jgi:DNA-3-methyladenine glycosylase II
MAARTSTPPFDAAEAIRHLTERDGRLGQLIAESGAFRLRARGLHSPYEALLEAIAYQSISRSVATTIFGRVRALGKRGRPPTPEVMLKLSRATLRKAGLSGAKILAVKDLARKTLAGVVPSLAQARRMADDELIERLVSVRGIGVWSVEMFLIFRLGRPDVLPVHDLGVRKGWAVAYDKKHMPTTRELLAFGERWRPYRTVASWYLWQACEHAGPATTRKIRPAPTRRARA